MSTFVIVLFPDGLTTGRLMHSVPMVGDTILWDGVIYEVTHREWMEQLQTVTLKIRPQSAPEPKGP